MRLLRDLQLSGLLGDLAALAQPQPALAMAPSEALPQTCAPAGEAGAFVLRRLAAAGHVVAELCLATRKAAAALSGQFAHSFFMPLCLTGLAILARIQACRPPVCARNDRVTPVAGLFRACYSQFSAQPLAGSVRTFLTAPIVKKPIKATDTCRCRRWRHSWRWMRRAPTMRSLLWCRRYRLTAAPLPSWVRTSRSLSSWHACTVQ